MFDSRAFVQALEVPCFVDLEGTTHTGRLLSHAQMTAHYEAIRDAHANVDKDPTGVLNVMLAACLQMFDAAAVEALKQMPGIAVEEALKSFFALHRPIATAVPPVEAPSPTATSS